MTRPRPRRARATKTTPATMPTRPVPVIDHVDVRADLPGDREGEHFTAHIQVDRERSFYLTVVKLDGSGRRQVAEVAAYDVEDLKAFRSLLGWAVGQYDGQVGALVGPLEGAPIARTLDGAA